MKGIEQEKKILEKKFFFKEKFEKERMPIILEKDEI